MMKSGRYKWKFLFARRTIDTMQLGLRTAYIVRVTGFLRLKSDYCAQLHIYRRIHIGVYNANVRRTIYKRLSWK